MYPEIDSLKQRLLQELSQHKAPNDVLKNAELKALYKRLADLPSDERSAYGLALNAARSQLASAAAKRQSELDNHDITPIDITAPWGANVVAQHRPLPLYASAGSIHPITRELQTMIDIFTRMGFEAAESRQIDSDWHMFGTLNFPDDHPARDDYDSFRTEDGFVPPAHTSTMQHRILKAGRARLELGGAIAAISYGRVFRNEDLDATHEHTFHQVEGVYVSKTASLANMLAVMRSFFETYYAQKLSIKTQPAYFPFVEPGLEFLIQKPAALGGQTGEWMEVMGCGMIHPNVLRAADIDPAQYQGFAWGGGVERLIMLAAGIEDIRHFQSAKLDFLKAFA